MKTCPDCKRTLPLDSFGNNKAKPDGKQNYCKMGRLLNAVPERDRFRSPSAVRGRPEPRAVTERLISGRLTANATQGRGPNGPE